MQTQLPGRLKYLERIEEWARFEELVYKSMRLIFNSEGLELNDIFQDVNIFAHDHLVPLGSNISEKHYGYFAVTYKTLPDKYLQTFTILGPYMDRDRIFMFEVVTSHNEGLKTNTLNEISRFILSKVI